MKTHFLRQFFASSFFNVGMPLFVIMGVSLAAYDALHVRNYESNIDTALNQMQEEGGLKCEEEKLLFNNANFRPKTIDELKKEFLETSCIKEDYEMIPIRPSSQ